MPTVARPVRPLAHSRQAERGAVMDMANVLAELAMLRKEVAALRKNIVTKQVARMTKPMKNVRELGTMRNKIAVILTAIRQKELNHG